MFSLVMLCKSLAFLWVAISILLAYSDVKDGKHFVFTTLVCVLLVLICWGAGAFPF